MLLAIVQGKESSLHYLGCAAYVHVWYWTSLQTLILVVQFGSCKYKTGFKCSSS